MKNLIKLLNLERKAIGHINATMTKLNAQCVNTERVRGLPSIGDIGGVTVMKKLWRHEEEHQNQRKGTDEPQELIIIEVCIL
jgi:hypothetical protein